MSKLSVENISNTSNSSEKFLQIYMGVLEKLAPQKKKCIRGNNMHFKNKTLIEVHRKISHLLNRYLKSGCPFNRIKKIKQRNYCGSPEAVAQRCSVKKLFLKIS